MEALMAATERIPLLVTPTQKALFIKKAKASKLTVNEFVRRPLNFITRTTTTRH
jgi:hypothetical protein